MRSDAMFLALDGIPRVNHGGQIYTLNRYARFDSVYSWGRSNSQMGNYAACWSQSDIHIEVVG